MKCRMKLNDDIDAFFRDQYNRLKATCKRTNISFTLTMDEYVAQYKSQEGRCFYTDRQMEWGVGKGRTANTLSIDKIVPERGYHKDNIVFCTRKANLVKNDLSLEELAMWMPGWYNRLKEKMTCQ